MDFITVEKLEDDKIDINSESSFLSSELTIK